MTQTHVLLMDIMGILEYENILAPFERENGVLGSFTTPQTVSIVYDVIGPESKRSHFNVNIFRKPEVHLCASDSKLISFIDINKLDHI